MRCHLIRFNPDDCEDLKQLAHAAHADKCLLPVDLSRLAELVGMHVPPHNIAQATLHCLKKMVHRPSVVNVLRLLRDYLE